jgi:hypothetical protein
VKIELEKGFSKKLAGKISAYNFEVGILQDKPHRNAEVPAGFFDEPRLGSYAGGPVRKATRQSSGKTIGEILIENMKRLNINFLLRPFQSENEPLIKFMGAFLKLAAKSPGMSIKRVENLLQAVVRNPILKQEYGRNKSATADAKGFDRHLVDTAQTFKAIKARAKRV